MKRLLDKYKAYLVVLCVLVLYVIFAFALRIPCPIKYVTGISCAGCGMSRAILSALTLDFAKSFEYHPLWVTVLPASVALAILGANEKKRGSMALLICLAALFLCTWIIRIASGDEVVEIDLEGGAIARLFS